MNEWMNERMNEWIKGWMNEWMNERMNEWKKERMKERTMDERTSKKRDHPVQHKLQTTTSLVSSYKTIGHTWRMNQTAQRIEQSNKRTLTEKEPTQFLGRKQWKYWNNAIPFVSVCWFLELSLWPYRKGKQYKRSHVSQSLLQINSQKCQKYRQGNICGQRAHV